MLSGDDAMSKYHRILLFIYVVRSERRLHFECLRKKSISTSLLDPWALDSCLGSFLWLSLS